MQGVLALLVSLAAQDPAPPPLRAAFISDRHQYYSLAFSPDGKLLAAGGSRFTRLFRIGADPARPVVEHKVIRQYGKVDEVLFASSGRALITRSRDQDGRIWNPEDGRPVKFAREDGGLGWERGGGILPEGPWLPLAHRSRGLKLWRLDRLWLKPPSVTRIELKSCRGVGLNRLTATAWAGRDLLLGDDQGYLLRVPRSKPLTDEHGVPLVSPFPRSPARAGIFRPHARAITSLSVSRDGKLCVSAGLDGAVKLWSVETIPVADATRRPGGRPGKPPAPKWRIPGHFAGISAAGDLLAVADGGAASVFHAASGIQVSRNPTRRSRGTIVRLAFSPDGKFLAGILCRCTTCSGKNALTVLSARRRPSEHGGPLVIWR